MSIPVLVNGPTQAYTLTVTIPATTAGNCLVVAVADQATASAWFVSQITLGGMGDNFGRVAAAAFVPGAPNAEIWADPNCAGGQTSVVISGLDATSVQSGAGSVWVYEFSGVANNLGQLLDRSSSFRESGTAWDSVATAVTSSPAEVWVGVVSAVFAVSTVPGAPWVNNQPSGGFCATGYQITTATGTADYAGTCVSGNSAAVVAALNPDPASAQLYQRSGPVSARWPG